MKSKIIKLTGTKIISNELQSLIGKNIMISINETHAIASKPYYMVSTDARRWGAGWNLKEAMKRAEINSKTSLRLRLILAGFSIPEGDDPARLPYIDQDGYTCHFAEHNRQTLFKGTLKEFREWLKTSNLQA